MILNIYKIHDLATYSVCEKYVDGADALRLDGFHCFLLTMRISQANLNHHPKTKTFI